MSQERNLLEEVEHLQEHWSITDEFRLPGYENYRLDRRKRLAEIILEFNPKSVLELGCFGGYNLREVNKLDPSIKLTGLDINNDALEYAKWKLPVMETINSSIHNLDIALKDRKFDVIYSAGVLIHIPSWDKVSQQPDTQAIIKIADDIIAHSNLGAVHAEEHAEEFTKVQGKGMRYTHNFNTLYGKSGKVTITEAINKGGGFEDFIKVEYKQ